MSGWYRSHLIRFGVPLVVAGLGGWIGFHNEVEAVTAAGKPPLNFRSATRGLMTSRTDRDAVQQLEALRQRIGPEEPSPLEKVECWNLIRNFSEDQVKACLAELPQSDERSNRYLANVYLTMMLFRQWARLDPEAAERGMKEEPFSKNRDLPYEVLHERISRDPDAARRWLESSNFDPQLKRIGARIIGSLLIKQDPANGLERAEVMGDDALGAALRSIARDMAGTPESRKEFYTLEEKYGEKKDWNNILNSIGWAAAERDAEEYLMSVKDSGLPTEQKVKMQDFALRMLIQTDPEKAMEWIIAPDANVPREKQVSKFSGWAWENPQESIEWAIRNGRQDLIAESVKNEAERMIYRDWGQWSDDSSGDEWITNVADRYEAWKAHDLKSAEAWVSSMPSDIRNYLSGRKNDATK